MRMMTPHILAGDGLRVQRASGSSLRVTAATSSTSTRPSVSIIRRRWLGRCLSMQITPVYICFLPKISRT